VKKILRKKFSEIFAEFNFADFGSIREIWFFFLSLI